jgi:hypothetical protein
MHWFFFGTTLCIISDSTVCWGYHNIRIKEGDEWKVTFRTHEGLFQPQVMFFGLCNSPATFQAMMNQYFHELISQKRVVIYLDDILIHSKTLEENISTTCEVLKILQENHLFLKPEKCLFHQTEIPYLGLIICENSIEMDPKKVERILAWQTPNKKKELQSFLGFINFYRRFIKDFAKIAQPLHRLTGKVPWEWTPDCEAAFCQLLRQVTSAPILQIANLELKYIVEADTSNFAIGAILSQEKDGKKVPIAYMSKALSPKQRNYDIWDKELLAIIKALEEWRHYLEGAQKTFEILSDHQNLKYFKAPHKLNRCQARWSVYLA